MIEFVLKNRMEIKTFETNNIRPFNQSLCQYLPSSGFLNWFSKVSVFEPINMTQHLILSINSAHLEFLKYIIFHSQVKIARCKLEILVRHLNILNFVTHAIYLEWFHLVSLSLTFFTLLNKFAHILGRGSKNFFSEPRI